jgi:hypothetical protein
MSTSFRNYWSWDGSNPERDEIIDFTRNSLEELWYSGIINAELQYASDRRVVTAMIVHRF